MKKDTTKIFVFADWKGLGGPQLMGVLSAQQAKGRKAFSFSYNKEWLKRKERYLLDPDIQFFSGAQYPEDKENFGIFLDSMPDTWGRTLLKRRAAQLALQKNETPSVLYDINFLLGVYDKTRMGALRFKLDLEDDFLDNDDYNPTPPWTSIRVLQAAAHNLQDDQTAAVKKWLAILMAPGSSLGGARPKANISDKDDGLWIAKFPSKNDAIDKGAWEYLAYVLATKAGIEMAPCKLEKVSGKYHTFFTKRFDRETGERLHFSSAMTMTGNNEEILKTKSASYLDIVDFIITFGVNVEQNLHQLWRRIVFNICISNTDDHLRNHGFILTPKGWILSPAYDLNPSVNKEGLALNIDVDNNALEIDLAKNVGEYFRLSSTDMDEILTQVKESVRNWRGIADKIGIPRAEQKVMQTAFRV